jgi:hypothetical protein
MENNKGSFDWIKEEIPHYIQTWLQLLQKPKEALSTIYAKKELDLLQIGIVTVLNAVIFLIVGNGLGAAIGSLIGVPVGIFISSVMLLFLTWIGKGNTEFTPLVNLAAYATTFTVVAGVLTRVPFIGGMIGFAAGIYALILQIMGIIQEAKADQTRVFIAVGVLVGIFFLLGILIVVLGLSLLSGGFLRQILYSF